MPLRKIGSFSKTIGDMTVVVGGIIDALNSPKVVSIR